jgi:hypothetical protein
MISNILLHIDKKKHIKGKEKRKIFIYWLENHFPRIFIHIDD